MYAADVSPEVQMARTDFRKTSWSLTLLPERTAQCFMHCLNITAFSSFRAQCITLMYMTGGDCMPTQVVTVCERRSLWNASLSSVAAAHSVVSWRAAIPIPCNNVVQNGRLRGCSLCYYYYYYYYYSQRCECLRD